MSVSRYEDRSEMHMSDTASIALQELEEERAVLEQRRRDLNDRRLLLDLERAELEQRMAALQIQYAFLDGLSARLDQQETMLVSETEGIRMTGEQLSPRRLKR